MECDVSCCTKHTKASFFKEKNGLGMRGVRVRVVRVQTNWNFLAKRKCQAHFQCERGSNMHPHCERMRCCGLSRMGRLAAVTPSTCSNQIQTDPKGNRGGPCRGSNLTGPGIRAEGVVLNISLCNEMRTVREYDWWGSRNVRAVRQLELLFFPKRQATFEDLDPSRWRGSTSKMWNSARVTC